MLNSLFFNPATALGANLRLASQSFMASPCVAPTGGLFQGLLGGSLGMPFMLGSQLGMMGLMMPQLSLQTQMAELLQRYLEAAQQAATRGSEQGARPARTIDALDALSLGDVRFPSTPAQGRIGIDIHGQARSSAPTYGKASDDLASDVAGKRYPLIHRLSQAATQLGSLDGSFVTAESTGQQDELGFGRLEGVLAAAEDDMKALEEAASPAERAALGAEEKKLRAAQVKARAQGVELSPEALAKQRVLYRERLLREGKISSGLGEQNTALRQMYRMKDRAEANMELKWGRSANLDAGASARTGSPFNPKRAATATGTAESTKLSPYRDYQRGAGLTEETARKAGLDPLPQWS